MLWRDPAWRAAAAGAHARARAAGGAPCRARAARTESAAADRLSRHRQGNAHRAVPGVSALINARLYFEAGVPGPPVFVVRFAEVDIQIDPFSLGRDFKLLVALDIRKIGADEDFSDIPIP